RYAHWVAQLGYRRRAADGGAGGGVASAPGRVDKHAGGAIAEIVTGVGHIDVTAGIQRDAKWRQKAGVAPADGGDWGGGAGAPGRIDNHAGGVVIRHIDVATGIQRDALWGAQAGDGGDGGGVAGARGGISRQRVGVPVRNAEQRASRRRSRSGGGVRMS